MTNSGRSNTSAASASAHSMAAPTMAVLPAMSPTVGLTWAQATRSDDITRQVIGVCGGFDPVLD